MHVINNRQLTWVWSTTGGAGKTTLSEFMCSMLPKVNLLTAGSMRDNAFRLSSTDMVWIIDLTCSDRQGLGAMSELPKLLEYAE